MYKNRAVTFYGYGLHEYRNEYLYERFSFYTGNEAIFKELKPLSKIEVLATLRTEYNNYKMNALPEECKGCKEILIELDENNIPTGKEFCDDKEGKIKCWASMIYDGQ